MTNSKVTFDMKTQLDLIIKQNKELQSQLRYERKLRTEAERRIADLEKELSEKPKIRTRRTKAEMEKLREAENVVYTDFKKNGVRKAHKTQSVKSYDEFKGIQDYFLSKGQVRNYMMWTVGVSFGIRISDLCRLKWINILDEKYKFRERILLFEKKTNKLQNCLITEAAVQAFTTYLNSISWNIDLNDYILLNPQTGKAITEIQGWRIINAAKNELKLDYPFGSHSMRNTFANIVLCVDKNTIDMNAITKIQGLLNHSDPRTTMRYLGTLQNMYDKARISVSDFILGKTDVNELIAGGESEYDIIIEKLDEILKK